MDSSCGAAATAAVVAAIGVAELAVLAKLGLA
ncbi:putative double-glycine peptidase [Sphingopyxis sp. OAS728]|nr:putative double-glycine peptidase [Sphingopyxis sp. OAS728]